MKPAMSHLDIRAILMGLAFAAMWSSAFSSGKIVATDAPPLTALVIRFLISGLIAIGIARALGQSWHLTRSQWISVLIFGLCQNAIYLGLNFVAMQSVQASLAAIIASAMPLIVALAGWLWFGDKLPTVGVLGLLAGVGGVALIMGTRLAGGVDLAGVIMCGIGVLALAFATMAVRSASAGGNLLMIVGLQMLVGSAALAIVAIPLETFDVRWSWRLAFAFTYTTFVPGLAATWIWFVLVGRIGAIRASTFHFLNPFLGVAVASVFLGEGLGRWDILGVTIITAGILAVQLSKQKT